jgi:hypothetical protein
MTEAQRQAFWYRFHTEIERFRERETDCDVAINSFEVRRWNVKFTRRRAGRPMATVTLAILEHAASTGEFLLAVTSTYVMDDTVAEAERVLIPVLFDPASDTFLLHADHGPVGELQMTDFFARWAGALLSRL